MSSRLIVLLVVAGTLAGCAAGQRPSLARHGTPLAASTRSAGCVARGGEPDPGCTPGAVLTGDRSRVCRRGYSRSVRDVPYWLKRRVYRAYGIGHHSRGSYEVDHLVPLALGGANDLANLWPQAAQPRPGFHEKDSLESVLAERVCSGAIVLTTAQRQIAADWLSMWRRYGSP